MEMQYKEVRDLVREEIIECAERDLDFSETMFYITGFIRCLNKTGVITGWDFETYERLIKFKNTLIRMWFD